MKRYLINENAEFSEILDRWGTFMLVNLLWVLCSLPVVTMPAATAGLFVVMSAWVRGKPIDLFVDFFGGMRQHWRRATLIGIVTLFIGGVLVMNMMIFQLMDMSHPVAFLARSVTIFVAINLAIISVYIWCLLVIVDMPLRDLLFLAVRLGLGHPLQGILILLGALLPVLLSVFLPPLILVFFAVSMSAYFVNWGAWRVIRRYMPDGHGEIISL